MTAQPLGSGLCRNCGTPATGRFCSYCGQATTQHPLSIVEFVQELVSHYVAAEGKLWQTLAMLTLQPGRLTHEYLVGRRARYVIPLRLYLTASFLFFALSQWVAQPVEFVVVGPAQLAGAVADKDAPAAPAADRARVLFDDPADSAEVGKALALAQARLCGAQAEADCPWWKRYPARAITNLQRDPAHVTERFTERFQHGLHYAMFLLLPIFAALLALVYAKRRMYYGEHLVFALHVHSFWFLLSFVSLLLSDALGLLLPIWFLAYGFWALRRVYGGRWGPTILRGLAVTVLYGLAISVGASVLSIALLAT